MSEDNGFRFELFEDYYGDAGKVQKIINECPVCGGKYVFSHFSDYRHLLIHETAHCPDCGTGKKKVLHVIN